MATFNAEVFSNEFLAEGATDVHAIVQVECRGAGTAGTGGGGAAAEIVIIDTSGSMTGEKLAAAKQAASVAIDRIVDGTWFAVIGGSHVAQRIFPYPNARMAMVPMERSARIEAQRAIASVRATGGTAMSTWLALADETFSAASTTQRHAILLTDGKNESEPTDQLRRVLAGVEGHFQCDARGVGQTWVVSELRDIASTLLGEVALIADPADLAADFDAVMRMSMARGVPEVRMRVWTPQGASLLFVRRVAPTVEDLTPKAVAVSELIREIPTGSWGDEGRDYHVAVRVPSRPIGSEQLAARFQVVVNSQVQASALIKARWSSDANLTARINPEVAHYTGQAELAQAIQEGLAAKAAGDEGTATVRLGRAVQLAHQTGNDEATQRLRKVVDVDDQERGTVRLRREATKLDEMALDTGSTKTSRVRR
ncbi:MAG: VWA domain-containing protein [Micrococcales bacterium]|nr:VWA domain-containing protein [Micrococcales bacterium]